MFTPTIGLLGVGLGRGEGGLARELLLEGPTEARGQVVGRGVPEAGRHAHGARAEGRCSNTHTHRGRERGGLWLGDGGGGGNAQCA